MIWVVCRLRRRAGRSPAQRSQKSKFCAVRRSAAAATLRSMSNEALCTIRHNASNAHEHDPQLQGGDKGRARTFADQLPQIQKRRERWQKTTACGTEPTRGGLRFESDLDGEQQQPFPKKARSCDTSLLNLTAIPQARSTSNAFIIIHLRR